MIELTEHTIFEPQELKLPTDVIQLDVSILDRPEFFGTSQELVRELLPLMILSLEEHFVPTVGFKILDPQTVSFANGYISTGAIEFRVRELIFSHFENSETIAIFLATLGGGYEKFREALGSSLLDAYMFDYLASEYIEKLCDHFYEMLSASVKQFNWGMTNRYSPGYCGWDVLEQKQLFNLLPPEFCGVTVNSFGLMSPLKSISGIIGLGAGCKREDYDCLFCSIDECLRRIE